MSSLWTVASRRCAFRWSVDQLPITSVTATTQTRVYPVRSTGSAACVQLITRTFATNQKVKTSSPKEEEEEAQGYFDKKRASKERRRELWSSHEQRKERLKTRRSSSGKPRDEKRQRFRSFFLKKKVDEEYMNRKAKQAGMDWEIHVAVIMERINLVLPDKEDWEIEYDNLKGHLSQFGKQYPKELTTFDYDQEIAVTDEELLNLLPKEFEPAPRVTEADKTGDVRTTDRKLKTSVYLAVQDNPITSNDDGDEATPQWQLPTVRLTENETLLQAAKRAVQEKVGTGIEFWCPSNAPCAVDMVTFSEEKQKKDGLYGSKKFFMKIQYDEGSVSERDMSVQDYAWLDRGEMVERVQKEEGDNKSKFFHYLL